MNQDEKTALAARITAHHLLVRELMLLYFADKPDQLDAFRDYAERLRSRLDRHAFPGIDAAHSDLMAQLLAESVEDILKQTEELLRLLPR